MRRARKVCAAIGCSELAEPGLSFCDAHRKYHKKATPVVRRPGSPDCNPEEGTPAQAEDGEPG